VGRSSFFRRLFAGSIRDRPGDVLAGEFVQCLWGGPIGFLKSKETNGIGLVWWFNVVGRYEIIDTKLLRKAAEPKVAGREAS
jgi:hypothetical protein